MLPEVKKNLNTIRKNFYPNLDSIVSQADTSNRTEESVKRENRLTVWVL